MGLEGFEPSTSPLSGVRSNQLSYRPAIVAGQSTLDRESQIISTAFNRQYIAA